MGPIVPDDFKMGMAVGLQKCNDHAFGFVCEGVQATKFDWESMHHLQLTIFDCLCDTHFCLHVSPCREFV